MLDCAMFGGTDVSVRSTLLHGGRYVSQSTPSHEITKLIRVTRAVRHIGNVKKGDGKWIDLMTPHALQIFLEVAQHPGINMKQLSAAAGVAHASISRNLMALGERHRRDMPGLGLIETIDDPYEYRRKLAFLTRKGRTFVSELVSIQSGEKVSLSTQTAKDFLTAVSIAEDQASSLRPEQSFHE